MNIEALSTMILGLQSSWQVNEVIFSVDETVSSVMHQCVSFSLVSPFSKAYLTDEPSLLNYPVIVKYCLKQSINTLSHAMIYRYFGFHVTEGIDRASVKSANNSLKIKVLGRKSPRI